MAYLIPRDTRFMYKNLEKIDTSSGRVYKTDEFGHVPSVTNILDRTKDKTGLKEWTERVGEQEAQRQKEEAAYVGTWMHKTLECFLDNEPLALGQDWLALRGHEMALRLINKYFCHLTSICGSEVNLHYKDRYAGTTDLVATYRGRLAIVDYKQAVKPKRHEHITDYFHQLAAYADAHDDMYGTSIDFGVILVAVQDGTTQEFTTTGREFVNFRAQWRERVTAAAFPADPASG
jgi:hypothetical protein